MFDLLRLKRWQDSRKFYWKSFADILSSATMYKVKINKWNWIRWRFEEALHLLYFSMINDYLLSCILPYLNCSVCFNTKQLRFNIFIQFSYHISWNIFRSIPDLQNLMSNEPNPIGFKETPLIFSWLIEEKCLSVALHRK